MFTHTHTYTQTPPQSFWQLVSGRTLARNLFTKYCRAKEPDLLAALLEGAGQTTELADLQVAFAGSTVGQDRQYMRNGQYVWGMRCAQYVQYMWGMQHLQCGRAPGLAGLCLGSRRGSSGTAVHVADHYG